MLVIEVLRKILDNNRNMKKNRFYSIVALCFVGGLLMTSCSKEDSLGESRLDTTPQPKSELDLWIDKNFVDDYNIATHYKWDQSMVDYNRYLFPPTLEKVQPALEVVRKIWLDTYNDVAGESFVKKIAPRELLLIGGVNLNTTGTITLGLAEGGMRITLFQTDYLDKSDLEGVRMFVHTIQHEYIHILNQTEVFDRKSFSVITPSGYTQDWYESSHEEARELGFITNYSRSNVDEDFAEMASMMLVYSPEEYNAIVNSISSAKAKEDIRKKEAIVVSYFRDQFDLDFYELCKKADEHTKEVIDGL